MIRHKIALLAVIGSVAASAAHAQKAKTDDPQNAVLPLTTKSAQVRVLMDQAWTYALDEVQQEKAIEVMQKVVAIDPTFAMGHELLAQTSLDPAEQVREQR